MNIWPKNTLEYWIKRAAEGEDVRVSVTATLEYVWRSVEALPREGYELYRVFQIIRDEERCEIRKPSVSSGGFLDDPADVKAENQTVANHRLARDIMRLEAAGITPEVKNRFSADLFQNPRSRTQGSGQQ